MYEVPFKRFVLLVTGLNACRYLNQQLSLSCLSLSNYKQNSCIASSDKHSGLQRSCLPLEAMQLLCVCVCLLEVAKRQLSIRWFVSILKYYCNLWEVSV